MFITTFFFFFLLLKECFSGLYGRDCLQNCSENCNKSKTCDGKTGDCLGGCTEGWKLPLCKEGTYPVDIK